jgi:uncharacterized protein
MTNYIITNQDILLLCIGTFVVSFIVSSIGPTGGFQLAIVAAILPPEIAIPIHGWINGVSSGFRAWNLRQSINWEYFSIFCIFSLLASSLATYYLIQINTHYLQIFIGTFIILSTILNKLSNPSIKMRYLSSPYIAGIITGFFTVFLDATGTLLITLLAPTFKKKEVLMATFSICLTIQHLSKILLFSSLGVTIYQYPTLLISRP